MKEQMVVDVSITVAWLFNDEQDEYAIGVARSARRFDFIVPVLWKWELANTLTIGVRRKRCRQTDVDAWLIYLSGMPFVIDNQCHEFAWSNTLEIATDHNLTVYDAAYLELARRESIPLATLDMEMKKAAKAAGVKLFRLDAGK